MAKVTDSVKVTRCWWLDAAIKLLPVPVIGGIVQLLIWRFAYLETEAFGYKVRFYVHEKASIEGRVWHWTFELGPFGGER